jgi:hypothetical protein
MLFHTLQQVLSKWKDWKTKNFKVLGAIKPKVLNRMAKLNYGHLWLREENLSFI